MKSLGPAFAACLLVGFISSVAFAESKIESVSEPEATVDANAAASESKSSRSELSVAPLDHVVYPDDRPAWVDQEPDLKSPVHTWVVVTSGCETMQQCEAELDVLQRAAVALYVKERTGWVCDDAMLDGQWIDDELVGRRYVGDLVRGDQALKEIAVELQFGPEQQQKILRAWKNAEVGDRLRATGAVFAMALVGLCCTGGLLGVFSRRFS
ncbi:hypothetical protein FYK55_11545 [Roseiconus nitratireducens]|uniref:Transmembrane protein n=1 Tax=Roseiconus nitratireducens TaxID=2605748 RepID=A0A5M6D8E2_9BACT|nr:hypothetical protein [Roseiconus nitratireducens]KAA5543801.1 hypothetical protein FYK55_11545 [Roseiconus nitratireducens]